MPVFRLSSAPSPKSSSAVSSSSPSLPLLTPTTPLTASTTFTSTSTSTSTSQQGSGSDTDTINTSRAGNFKDEEGTLTPASMHQYQYHDQRKGKEESVVISVNPITPSTSGSSTNTNNTSHTNTTSTSISASASTSNIPTTTITNPSLSSPKYTSPPITQYPYTPDIALTDIPAVTYALDLFLQSKMLESEAYLVEQDKDMERLYIATGFGLIQCVKGLMSYEDVDLLAGIQHTKQGNHIASLHRKKAAFLGSRLAGYVVSSVSSALHPGSVQWIKSMTDVERHAELVYAESLFEKALLGIVYSGDWLAFIKEALNMRTTISIYRQLGSYLDHMDALSSPPGTPNPAVDADFRSGVLLGVGMSNIILSLMPGKLATLVELFGYKGDRGYGLECLMRAGGWVEGRKEPGIGAAEEGVRRSICDMSLLIFHLVLSSFTFSGVSIPLASHILSYNLARYPTGVFFLFGAGRLALMRSKPKEAIGYYERAMQAQGQYRNLHHVSYWEIAVANFALWEVGEGARCWRELEREATWSKAIYSYGLAVCLIEVGNTEEDEKERKESLEEAARLMEKVPSLRQKIAGKSIPLEKFVARKARKFHSQNQRLLLPALEMAYVFQGIAHAPRRVILDKMLPEVRAALGQLGWEDEVGVGAGVGLGVGVGTQLGSGGVKERKDRQEVETGYGEKRGGGYWDDYALAMFLRGVCMRYVAYPDPDAEIDVADTLPTPGLASISKEEAEREAEASFKAVFEHGPKIELDHQLVYHAHYELGRLLACQGGPSHLPHAKYEFELVLSGKPLEVGASGRKGKYSMENALHMRTHAALDVLEQMQRGEGEKVGRRL